MDSEDAARANQPSTDKKARKPYGKPELLVYGDLAKLTQTLSGQNTDDGSGHPNKHHTS